MSAPSSCAKMDTARPGVRRFLDLSTGHLPHADRVLLTRLIDQDDDALPSSVHVGPYGWFFYVGDAPNFARWTGSPALRNIFTRAQALACDYVLLDADGPADDILPFFDED